MEEKKAPSLNINVEPLRTKSIYICTPAYGGQVNINYMNSCLGLTQTLSKCGIPHEFAGMANESLIPRARNRMVNWFLQKPEHTHLMFIDSDIEFVPADVVALLHFDKDVIAAPYPLKGYDWKRIQAGVLKTPDTKPEEIELMGSTWATHLFEGNTRMDLFQPLEVKDVATGFVLIKREVFKQIETVAEKYTTAPNEPGMTPENYDYFPSRVMDGQYMSEDYGFCRMWAKLGGKIHLCPWMQLNHFGTARFRGDLFRTAQLTGEVH